MSRLHSELDGFLSYDVCNYVAVNPLSFFKVSLLLRVELSQVLVRRWERVVGDMLLVLR